MGKNNGNNLDVEPDKADQDRERPDEPALEDYLAHFSEELLTAKNKVDVSFDLGPYGYNPLNGDTDTSGSKKIARIEASARNIELSYLDPAIYQNPLTISAKMVLDINPMRRFTNGQLYENGYGISLAAPITIHKGDILTLLPCFNSDITDTYLRALTEQAFKRNFILKSRLVGELFNPVEQKLCELYYFVEKSLLNEEN